MGVTQADQPPTDQTPTKSLQDFVRDTAERDNPGEVFELESPKMLEVKVGGPQGARGRIWSKLGAMVAYKGNLTFKREGLLEGGIMKALVRAVSSEMEPLAKIEGQVAHALAFEDTVSHDVTMHRRVAGMASGGLFSVKLRGQGMVAILSHGTPLTLRVTPQTPIYTDPNATVAWSENLQPQIRLDANLRSFLGRGGGETLQMVFQGDGFVVVQPYEEHAGLRSDDSGNS